MPVIPLTVVLASVVFLAALGVTGFTLKDPLRARLQGFAWGGAFIVGGVLLSGRLPWPMYTAIDGLILSAAVLAAFIAFGPRQQGVRYLVRAVVVVVVGGFVLWPLLPSLTGQVHLRNLLAFFFLGLGLWSVLERVSQQVNTPALILLPTMTAASTIVFLSRIDAGLIILPVILQTWLMLAALVVAVAVPTRISAACALPFISVFVVAQLAAIHFYLRVNPWTMVFLCAPYAVLWMRSWLPLIPREPRKEMITLGVLAAFPLAYVLLV